MARITNGDRILLFFRPYKNRFIDDGAKLRFQTEHSISKEKEKDTKWTKDGVQTTVRDGETAVDIKSLKYEEDEAIKNVFDELEEVFDDNELLETWEVNLDKVNADGDYIIKYFQGFLESFEYTAGDSGVEATMKYAANGKGVIGTDKLSEAQLAAIDEEAYEYHSIQKLTEPTPTEPQG